MTLNQAQLKAFRRKLQNKIKQGAKEFGPSALAYTERNLERNELIQLLNHEIDVGSMGQKVAARKTKKALSVDWQNRDDSGSLKEYWNEDGKRMAVGRCDAASISQRNKTKRGY